jgi:excisionase family DNA binding protein
LYRPQLKKESIDETSIHPRAASLPECPGSCRGHRVSRSIIYLKIRSGELASLKIGKRRVIPSNALQAWADALTRRAAAA